MLASTFSCCKPGIKSIFIRLFMLPICMALMWIFYNNIGVSNYFVLMPNILYYSALKIVFQYIF